jgi:hypothetical protein
MDLLIELACGMDVHKDSITACVMTPEGKEIQTFFLSDVDYSQCQRGHGQKKKHSRQTE